MNARSRDHQPSVSLVLGAGGARGYAHIGVIDALETRGYRIQSIAGCSMGAVIGGIYASGKLEVYRRWVCALERMDVIRLLDFSLIRNGLIKGERLMEALRELIGDSDIEDLPIAFTAVATDIERQKEVWMDRGGLFDAIRASIAIPTIFTAAEYDGRILLDGGLLNPVPVAPTLSDNTDLTVAVNLSGKPERRLNRPRRTHLEWRAGKGDRLAISQFLDALQARLGQGSEKDLGLTEVITKSWDTMQNTIARFQSAVYSPDITIDIPANACAFWEFHRAREMIDLGRERAESVLEES
jgi:NTE family protein